MMQKRAAWQLLLTTTILHDTDFCVLKVTEIIQPLGFSHLFEPSIFSAWFAWPLIDQKNETG